MPTLLWATSLTADTYLPSFNWVHLLPDFPVDFGEKNFIDSSSKWKKLPVVDKEIDARINQSKIGNNSSGLV